MQIFIEIRDGKHPCITSDDFIPNDTSLATDDAASFMILTGPNMGGKSTLMRQVGLITIMAQIVSFSSKNKCARVKLTIDCGSKKICISFPHVIRAATFQPARAA